MATSLIKNLQRSALTGRCNNCVVRFLLLKVTLLPQAVAAVLEGVLVVVNGGADEPSKSTDVQ